MESQSCAVAVVICRNRQEREGILLSRQLTVASMYNGRSEYSEWSFPMLSSFEPTNYDNEEDLQFAELQKFTQQVGKIIPNAVVVGQKYGFLFVHPDGRKIRVYFLSYEFDFSPYHSDNIGEFETRVMCEEDCYLQTDPLVGMVSQEAGAIAEERRKKEIKEKPSNFASLRRDVKCLTS